MSRIIAVILCSLLVVTGFPSSGLEAGTSPGSAEGRLALVKPPYVHISKFRKKRGTGVVVLKVYVCAEKPKDGVATTTSCKASSEKKTMGDVTSAEIKITDAHGKVTYCSVKNVNDLDERYKGDEDLEFDSKFLEPNTEYSVTLTVNSRNNTSSSTTHKAVSLRTPR